ncbi:hypothetical protein Tco_0021074 [Tanacetum coccineum]
MWKITTAFLRGEVAAGNQFALLTKTPKEILALDKGKFKPPPLMTTPVEKRNASKFYKKAVAFDLRVEAKQWKMPSKGGKEGRSRRKGQATSNPDGTVGTEDSQTKGPWLLKLR